MKTVSRDKFMDLLHGAFNISDEAEPGTTRGERMTEAGLRFADELFFRLERAKPGEAEGIAIVARLFTECQCSEDPDKYAEIEARRGNDGERHENDKAGIPLPKPNSVRVPKRVGVTS